MISRRPSLDSGVYSIAQVASYVGMSPATVRSWFLQRSDARGQGPVLSSDYGVVDGVFVVSFLDLIDTLIAAQFRSLGVSMKEVRVAHRVLAAELAQGHPFCHQDLYTDGERILRLTSDRLDDVRLSEVVTSQQLFVQIKQRLAHVSYSAISRLAESWNIADGVVIDPTVGMGRPAVQSTGTSTYVIANAYLANGQNPNLIADLYNLDPAQVMNAVRFESSLNRAA